MLKLKLAQRRWPDRHDPRRAEPATTGGDDVSTLVGPEEKAAITRGQTIVGNITLAQVLGLAQLGYGNEVRRWTAYRAEQVLRDGRHKGPSRGKRKSGWRPRLGMPVAIDAPASSRSSLMRCPTCNSVVAPRNLARHLRRIHGRATT